jgi:uncharacterized iron-regulated membrane protein
MRKNNYKINIWGYFLAALAGIYLVWRAITKYSSYINPESLPSGKGGKSFFAIELFLHNFGGQFLVVLFLIIATIFIFFIFFKELKKNFNKKK